MMVFVLEGTVVDKGRFVKMVNFLFKFVDITCQALLADQMGSFDMEARFGKLYTYTNIPPKI